MKAASSFNPLLAPLTGFLIGVVAGVLLGMPTDGNATSRPPSISSPGCDLALSTGPMAAWRRSVESDRPLFEVMSPSVPVSCQFNETEGVLRNDYRFSNGNTLRASLDTRINHLSLIGHMAGAPSSSRSILTAAEQALFGPAGCGIDWADLDNADDGTIELQGDKCHCRASVDRARGGAVTFFSLRAACGR